MNRIFLFGIVLIAAVVLGALVTYPKYQDYQAQVSAVQEQERELSNREAYFKNLRSIEAGLSSYPQELAKVEAAIPDSPQLPLLYDFLQQTAAASGMVLGNITSSVSKEPKEALQTISLNLELVGPYESFKEFLLRLQSSSRMVQVSALKVSEPQKGEELGITLQLTAYSY